MSDHNEPFTPQSVDEQIEQFAPRPEQSRQDSPPETRLVMDMHDLYGEYAGTRDRVRRRLQERLASRNRAMQAEEGSVRSLPVERQGLQRKKDMYSIAPSPVKTHTLESGLRLIAITLCAALLVVALAVIVPFMRSHSTQPNNNPAAGKGVSSTVIGQPKAVYITNGSGILKLDPNTGKTLQTYPWPDKGIYHTGGTIQPYTLQMSGGLLFVGFKLINSGGHLIYGGVQAFNIDKGKMLWEVDGTTNYESTLTISAGTVYLSVDHPDIANNSLVFALGATDGKQLAVYTLPLPVYQLVVTHGFLYAKDYGDLYALNLSTQASWRSNGPQGVNLGYTDFQVIGGVLYASAYSGSNSHFVELDAATGAQRRSTEPIPGKIFNFTIVQNVAYFGTDKALPNVSGDNLGRLDAYDLGQFKVLWQVTAPSVARTYTVSNGVVYAVTSFPYPGGVAGPELMAFDANNGNILWNTPAGSQQFSYVPMVTHGHIYIAASAQPQSPGGQMEMVDQASGKTLWKTPFTSPIGGYVVTS